MYFFKFFLSAVTRKENISAVSEYSLSPSPPILSASGCILFCLVLCACGYSYSHSHTCLTHLIGFTEIDVRNDFLSTQCLSPAPHFPFLVSLGGKEIGYKNVVMRWGYFLQYSLSRESQFGLHLRNHLGALNSQGLGHASDQSNKNSGEGCIHWYFSKRFPRWSQSAAKAESHRSKNIYSLCKLKKTIFFHRWCWVRNDWGFLSNSSIYLCIHPSIHPSVIYFIRVSAMMPSAVLGVYYWERQGPSQDAKI